MSVLERVFNLYYKSVRVFMCLQVSTAAAPLTQSHAQTFTIGVLPQIPGFPQLAPDCDLQITVRDSKKTYPICH